MCVRVSTRGTVHVFFFLLEMRKKVLKSTHTPQLRLRQLSCKKFEQALRTTPANPLHLVKWGNVIVQLASMPEMLKCVCLFVCVCFMFVCWVLVHLCVFVCLCMCVFCVCFMCVCSEYLWVCFMCMCVFACAEYLCASVSVFCMCECKLSRCEYVYFTIGVYVRLFPFLRMCVLRESVKTLCLCVIVLTVHLCLTCNCFLFYARVLYVCVVSLREWHLLENVSNCYNSHATSTRTLLALTRSYMRRSMPGDKYDLCCVCVCVIDIFVGSSSVCVIHDRSIASRITSRAMR